MQHISTVTVGSGGAASITFSAIPATFTDLVLKLSLRASANGDNQLILNFNTSGGSYSFRRLRGDGGSASSFSESGQSQYNGYAHLANPTENTASTFSNTDFYIPNYRSGVAKSFSVDSVTENNGTTAFQLIVAGLWSGTDAITGITLKPSAGGSVFVEHSSLSLFGVLAGSDGIVAVS